VVLDGSLADAEVGGDILAGMSGQHLGHDLLLSRRQGNRGRFPCARTWRGLGFVIHPEDGAAH
jgi:hypothetical protein